MIIVCPGCGREFTVRLQIGPEETQHVVKVSTINALASAAEDLARKAAKLDYIDPVVSEKLNDATVALIIAQRRLIDSLKGAGQ